MHELVCALPASPSGSSRGFVSRDTPRSPARCGIRSLISANGPRQLGFAHTDQVEQQHLDAPTGLLDRLRSVPPSSLALSCSYATVAFNSRSPHTVASRKVPCSHHQLPSQWHQQMARDGSLAALPVVFSSAVVTGISAVSSQLFPEPAPHPLRASRSRASALPRELQSAPPANRARPRHSASLPMPDSPARSSRHPSERLPGHLDLRFLLARPRSTHQFRRHQHQQFRIILLYRARLKQFSQQRQFG